MMHFFHTAGLEFASAAVVIVGWRSLLPFQRRYLLLNLILLPQKMIIAGYLRWAWLIRALLFRKELIAVNFEIFYYGSQLNYFLLKRFIMHRLKKIKFHP